MIKPISARVDGDNEDRISEILDQYLADLECGVIGDINQVCDENPDLAEELKGYFATLNTLHGFANSVRGTKAVEAACSRSKTFDGFQLGDYRILKELGRGGMGVVYAAEQVSLQRKVAIKLLPIASGLSERQITRFKNESLIASQLQHPNIVPIYAVGCDQGIHYFSMQLIHGFSAESWIEKQKASGSLPDWKQVVAWGATISAAIHVAHENGVIHRDIKPSNLLVDRANRIWITDFGLARFHSDVTLTQSGDLVGTYRYMSPEQASGRRELVDHRSDVYSLAVTLFEMLTLEPAIADADTPAPELLHAITHNDPPRVPALGKRFPRELGVVLQTAMAKRKDDRYESARAFADDLQAVLNGDPIQARAPSHAKRMSRKLAKHKRLCLTITVLILVTLSWTVLSSNLISQAQHREQMTAMEAKQYFNQARTTVDHLGTRIAQQLASVPGAESVRATVLQDTLNYYEQFLAQAGNNPSLVAQIAQTHNQIGTLKQQLSLPHEAVDHYRKSNLIYTDNANAFENESFQRSAAKNLNDLGLALFQIDQLTEAEEVLREAVTFGNEIIQGGNSVDEDAIRLAVAKTNLSRLLLRGESGSNRHLLRLLKEARSSLERYQSPFARRALASTLSTTANAISTGQTDGPERAQQLIDQAIEIHIQLAADSSNKLRFSSELARLYNQSGAMQIRRSRLEEASDSLQRAAELQEHLVLIAPQEHAYRRDLALTLNNLATVRQKQDRHQPAISLSAEAVSHLRECASKTEDAGLFCLLGVTLHNQAASLMSLQRHGDAIVHLTDAIACQNQSLNLNESANAKKHLITHHSNLLRCYVALGQWHMVQRVTREYRKLGELNLTLSQSIASDIQQIVKFAPTDQDHRRARSELSSLLRHRVSSTPGHSLESM